MSEDNWKAIKTYIESCICICFSFQGNHERLTYSEERKTPQTHHIYFSNPVLEDNISNFSLSMLDSPSQWKSKTLNSHSNNNFVDVDLSDNALIICPLNGHRQDTDSKSTGRESGYGQSIEESLDGPSEVTVGVMEDTSRTTYKLVVQDPKRCWFVFRRQLDFIYIQEYIKKHVIGPVIKDLPLAKKAKIQELQLFIQSITSDPRILQLPKVREFLHLNRHRSSTGSSSNSSDESIPLDFCQQSKPRVILNPSMLPPLRPCPLPSPISKRTMPNSKVSPLEQPTIPNVHLGCEEKKMAPSDFDFLTLIGKGSFGKVYLARRKETDRVYAVKMLSKKLVVHKNETAHVLSERSALTRVLCHPYIVSLHYAFTTHTKIFFVLDYVPGGELFYHLQKERTFSEKRTRFYGAEICCALTYMHSKGIVYRDLKPENILLDREGHVVLTDFGLCKEGIETDSSRTSTFCGTPEYLAPEVILKKSYTRSVDWWTYGAVLYEMIYGLPPFYYKDTRVMYEAIISKPLRLRPTVSTAARDLLSSLLHKSPHRRLGSGPGDGNDVKAHNFFRPIDWVLIEKRGVAPPYVPKVTSDDDTSNIDPLFTREKMGTPSIGPACAHSCYENKAFRGFSYVCQLSNDGER